MMLNYASICPLASNKDQDPYENTHNVTRFKVCNQTTPQGMRLRVEKMSNEEYFSQKNNKREITIK